MSLKTRRRPRLMKFYIIYSLLFFLSINSVFSQSEDIFFSKISPYLPSQFNAKYSTSVQGNIGLLNVTGIKLGFNGRFNDIEYSDKKQSPFRWMQHYGMGLWVRSFLPLVKGKVLIYADASVGYCLLYFPYEETLTNFVSRIKPRYFGYYHSIELGVRYKINKNFTLEFFSPDLSVRDFKKQKIQQISTAFPTFAIQLLITKPF